ncbi:hypothetical protein HMPREF0995_00579 [Lachnospiraceae bacterium 7_1_58FAA]|jgi:glycosyltransferase involved in cell wall biosynthesis|nr:hypothetical protein HMPREF0995_00579 [Lachnospiraceae bacterium 7_1_58FAA]
MRMKANEGFPQSRVCIFSQTWSSGGIESFFNNLLHYMDLSHFEVDIVVEKLEESIFRGPLEELGVSFYELSGSSHRILENYKEFARLIKRKKYDVLHLNVFQAQAMMYLRLAKNQGIPIRIAHSHNTELRRSRTKWLKMLVHEGGKRLFSLYATDFWACSQLAARFMFPKNVVKKEQYCFIPNGINLEKFQFNISTRREKRKELHLENTFVIGNIGRLCYQKNQRFLLNVFSDVYQNMPESRLLLVGDGDDRKELELYAESLGLLDSVIIYGTSNHVEELLCAMDVFAFPSLFEGLGIAMIEAQASGLPVICSDQIPKESVVSDDVYRISVHDRDGWVKALLRMDGGRQKCLLENELLSNYDIRRLSRQMEKIYCRKRKNG